MISKESPQSQNVFWNDFDQSKSLFSEFGLKKSILFLPTSLKDAQKIAAVVKI